MVWTETLIWKWINEMKALSLKGNPRATKIIKDYNSLSIYEFRRKYC